MQLKESENPDEQDKYKQIREKCSERSKVKYQEKKAKLAQEKKMSDDSNKTVTSEQDSAPTIVNELTATESQPQENESQP